MDFLKKIRQKIDEFCFNHMRMDGAQHLIAGILIYDVLKYLIPVWSAILITLIILVAKEVVLDKDTTLVLLFLSASLKSSLSALLLTQSLVSTAALTRIR